MAANLRRSGITLVELIVVTAIVSMMMGYAWKIFLSGQESGRHTLTQSQMQSDARIFFDRISRDISAVYEFFELDPDNSKLGFYSFQYTRTPLDNIFFNYSTGASLPPDRQAINVLKVEYFLDTEKNVTRQQTPGYLYFTQNPPIFQEGPAAQYEGTENAAATRTILRNIESFVFKGYRQKFTRGQNPPVSVEPAASARETTFIALRVHSHIDEGGTRRDEELDLVAKLYSRHRLAEEEFPGSFSSVDANTRF